MAERVLSLGGRVEVVKGDPWPSRPYAAQGTRLCFAPVGSKDGWARAEVAPAVRRAPITFGSWEVE